MMNEKGLELIPSEYVREYYRENGIELSDRQRALIVWNDKAAPLEKRIAAVEKIAAETSDEGLKRQTAKTVKRLRNAVESVKQPTENCVYRIKFEAHQEIIFPTYDEAMKRLERLDTFLKNRGKNFALEKVGFAGHFYADTLGYIVFNCDREIMHAHDCIEDWADEVAQQITICRDFNYIPFASPFERGDIVRDCRSGRVGVVDTSREGWEKFLKLAERYMKEDKYRSGEITFDEMLEIKPSVGFNFADDLSYTAFRFNDTGVAVVFFEGGKVECKIIQPIFLEKIPFDELDTENSPDNAMLLNASEMLRGVIMPISILRDRTGLTDFISDFKKWETVSAASEKGGKHERI
ncbi:MAG: hypothetical protein NC299_14695 [Lachnospiraceae bacterium]|nr:hypothetical protein [Ruminococcus sp.]MCM1276585.1 hypothetical protein [Lachnospiraceae bacterium]